MGSPEGKNGLIHFGPFELDPDAEQLRKSGVALRLQPQQFVVLLLLAQRAGEVVSRREIQQRVWGEETFVDFERSINFCINQIRAALGDDADRPRYIETLPRRGYRFIANVDRNGKAEADVCGSLAPKTQHPWTAKGKKCTLVCRPLFCRDGKHSLAFWCCWQLSGSSSLSCALGVRRPGPSRRTRLQRP